MAVRTQNNNYWSKRSIERIVSAEKNSLPYIRQIKKIYRNSAKETVNEVKKLYATYYKNDGSFDTVSLEKIANKGDIKRFLADMKRLGLSTYLPKNYKGRMTRQELLNAQIWGNIKKLAIQEQNIDKNLFQKTYEDTYYKTIYDISKGTNENIAFSTLDQRTIENVLSTKFYGENYSQRIWHNTDDLAKDLQSLVGQAIINGESNQKLAKRIMMAYGTQGSPKGAYYNAYRLARTETNYFENKSELDSYKELGIKKFKFLATLDSRTSEICREHDGKIYDVDKAVQGEDAPPLHPNCVLPDTRVIVPDMYSATKASYSGDIFEFTTSNGRRFSVTPNHIMLTDRGFVRAKFIRQGDNVIDYCGWGERTIASPTDDNCPPTAEQLFASFSKTSGVTTTSMPVSTEYLKGDISKYGNIDVVFINSFFNNKGDFSSPEFIGDCQRINASMAGSSFFSNGTITQILMASAFASDCIMSGNSVSNVLGASSISHHDLISLLNTTLYDSRLVKTAVDNISRNSKFSSKFISALSSIVRSNDVININIESALSDFNLGLVKPIKNSMIATSVKGSNLPDALSRLISFDNIVSVNRKFYEGHIYDFSSLSTLYVAEGVLASNCRSGIVPYLGKDYEPEARIARDPQTGKNMTIRNMNYGDWYETYVKNVMPKTDYEKIGVSKEYWKTKMTPEERRFTKKFGNNIKWIDRFKRGESGNIEPTNDFIWNKKEYELKTPKKLKYKNISRTISETVPKGKYNFMINLENRILSQKLENQLKKYNLNNPNNKINELWVFSKGEIKKII